MKIIHLLDHSLPLHSGYTFRSRNILLCQLRQGLRPVAVTSPKHEAAWSGEWRPKEEFDGIAYHRSGPVSGRVPVWAEIRLMARSQTKVREVAREESPAVIHAHSPVLNAFPALRIGRERRVPVVYEIRAFWEDAAVDHGTHREWGLRYRLTRALETRACRRADAVVTICEGLRSDLVSRGIPSEKITVVPNAVDPEELRPVPRDPALRARWGVGEADFVIGFIGSFYHYEGLDLLLHALAYLKEGRGDNDSRFTIHDSRAPRALLIGGGQEDERLRALAQDLGVADRVVFAGRIPHAEVPAAYAACDALVLPRKSIRLTELVTPLKPLEAMALNTPVIASDVGGHKELVRDGETGLLFPAGDPAALADRILALARSPDLANRLRENGRRWVTAERTWKRNGEIYREVYGKTLGR
ncbi:TIGR04063 family PEP-CTERM/XrtA system glycosyltransferase [Deferrisoma camini]|uniref:TIGR04063 family PEP-CTERM/XrtA system glycosyltransferase n=1 Tax=Deferrisoma camini TaxID=1035120 RepID=UPI00046CEC2E|nr:TIGR04063 family PEP-CTERM/XrtA system glycosyltransferase [Deferrisoma camini]